MKRMFQDLRQDQPLALLRIILLKLL